MGEGAQCAEGYLENPESRSWAGSFSVEQGAVLGRLHPYIGQTGVCAAVCTKWGASTCENHSRPLKSYPGVVPRWGTEGGEVASAWPRGR